MRARWLDALRLASGFVVLLGASIGAQHPQLLCPPCAAVDRSQSGLDTLPPEALADRTWALGPKGINVLGLADLADGSHKPGFGTTIVQIDTGVTTHPVLPKLEIVNDIEEGGVDFTAADGLFGPGQTNIDPLLTGFLRFPGHGTKTGSVIAGRPSGIFAGANAIGGVAPGAVLIPVRATQGVLLLPGKVGELDADQHRVARAINEASKHTQGLFRRKIDVVSMSLGGWPPTPDLCEAVEAAARSGIIVVVAAGNVVRRAKYPAQCKGAIGIAGSTYGEDVWSGSAGSPEVTAAAPAEGVWTASVKAGAFCVEASSGTSFATALVAGMAADWLAVRRRLKTEPASPPEEFKRLLGASARPWKNTKLAKKYGAGIADMKALMQEEGRAR